MGHVASFLLDPLNITGIQKPLEKRPSAPTPPPAYVPPSPQKQDIQGFIAGMGGLDNAVNRMGRKDGKTAADAPPPPPPSWVYTPGKGPQFQQHVQDPNKGMGNYVSTFDAPYTKNRF